MVTRDVLSELTECRATLRAMALVLARAEDAERARIARGLHDDLGQTLAAVQLRLAELERAGTEGARRTIIAAVSDLVGEAIESSRTLTFELMAPVMPEIGIDAELEHLATRLMEESGTKCRFDSDSEPKPVSPEVAVALLRVTCELLVNVKKHADAETAIVAVTRVGDRIRVAVSDDGIGFEPHSPTAPERAGFGLLIVEERLARIGGDVEIDSSQGSGARIVVTAPLLLDAGETR